MSLTGHVQITVEDSGPGIRTEDVERMFDSFYTTKAKGMGMGLAISRAIVEGHGGMLKAVPDSRGRLCFTLPIEEIVGE